MTIYNIITISIITHFLCNKLKKMLFLSSILLLISNAVSLRRDKSILYSRISLTILICCSLVAINSVDLPLLYRGLGLFGGLYSTTIVSIIFQIFILLVSILIIQLNAFFPRKIIEPRKNSLLGLSKLKSLLYKFKYLNLYVINKMSQQYRIIEYPLIILLSIIGGAFLISSSDFISVFLSIELQSYALYILCAVYRNSEKSTSGALTYFLLGGLSSCFILLAFSLIYSNSGNTGFDGLYVVNNISKENINLYIDKVRNAAEIVLTNVYQSNYLNFSLIIFSVGFLFKIGAAPFHFWSPDVYDAIPTVTTTFVAVFAKISILVLFLELVHYTNSVISVTLENYLFFDIYSVNWTIALLMSSLLSLIIGSVLGLTQFRIKRLYAFSTISHLGFILLALVINTVESTQSFIFYLMQYSISNINAFLLLIAIGYFLFIYIERVNSKDKKLYNEQELTMQNELSDKNNSPIQLITDIKGFFHLNPILALSLAITLFSFVGIPPLIGFFGKQMVLTSALDNGYLFMSIIAILTSVISAYYYLVLVKQMFFENSDYSLNPGIKGIHESPDTYNNTDSNHISHENIHLNGSLSIVISMSTLLILFFIIVPQEWLSGITIMSMILFNP